MSLCSQNHQNLSFFIFHTVRRYLVEVTSRSDFRTADPDLPNFVCVLQNAVLRIRDPVPFWPLDPGSGIGFFRIPDRSRIPNPDFWELSDNFLGKKFYNSLIIGPNFFLQHFKTKTMYSFVKFVATLKGMTSNFFYPSLLLLFLDPGSEIRDGYKLGSGINIPDPPHWQNILVTILHCW